MSTIADRNIAALRTSHDSLAAIVRDLDADDLVRPSGASEWTLAQVFSHLGSGAEIGLATLRAALDGTDTPGAEFNQGVWDRWNAKTPREQADDFVTTNAELVATYEGLDSAAREELRITLSFLPFPADVPLVAGMRLSEAVLHQWDIEVGLDPAATVAADSAEVLVDVYSGPLATMMGYLGKADALGGRKVTLRVETSAPSRTLGLSIAESVGFVDAPEQADAVLTAPAEAWVRLLTGRMAAAHTPGDVTLTGDAVTLDDLRKVFPGY
jgi:uncharacterized protein (TIGR03083 family)